MRDAGLPRPRDPHLAPPLVITESELDDLFARFDRALAARSLAPMRDLRGFFPDVLDTPVVLDTLGDLSRYDTVLGDDPNDTILPPFSATS